MSTIYLLGSFFVFLVMMFLLYYPPYLRKILKYFKEELGFFIRIPTLKNLNFDKFFDFTFELATAFFLYLALSFLISIVWPFFIFMVPFMFYIIKFSKDENNN